MSIQMETLDFDPDALALKYRQERDKRVRVDGNDQYQEVVGEFAYFVEDPYIEQALKREPLLDDVEVVIIGGGFGGLLAAARLREAGIHDFRIIEKGGDFGGTWYWNRYPGASCDIESYVYFPLLEQTKFVPKQKYTNAPETLEYCQEIAQQFQLYDNALLQTEVRATDWRIRSKPASLCTPTARSIGRNYLRSKVLTISKVIPFIPAAGTITIPEAMRWAI